VPINEVLVSMMILKVVQQQEASLAYRASCSSIYPVCLLVGVEWTVCARRQPLFQTHPWDSACWIVLVVMSILCSWRALQMFLARWFNKSSAENGELRHRTKPWSRLKAKRTKPQSRLKVIRNFFWMWILWMNLNLIELLTILQLIMIRNRGRP